MDNAPAPVVQRPGAGRRVALCIEQRGHPHAQTVPAVRVDQRACQREQVIVGLREQDAGEALMGLTVPQPVTGCDGDSMTKSCPDSAGWADTAAPRVQRVGDAELSRKVSIHTIPLAALAGAISRIA